MNKLLPPLVTLDPVPHKYFDTDGKEYMSVSSILGHLHEEFDVERASYFSARKQLRLELAPREPTEPEILLRQKALKFTWKQRNTDSINIGSYIHNSIEEYLKFGSLPVNDEKLFTMIPNMVQSQLSGYKAFFSEEVIYSKKYFIAGTADYLGIRIGGQAPVVDISDFKTNASKGILYHSEYNKWMLDPISHLEDCNYIKYVLQLSIYAWMLEEHGFRPGRKKLIYIPPADPSQFFPIPVPYMRAEVEMILSYLEAKGTLRTKEALIWE